MIADAQCPKCGTALPGDVLEGLCPKCLARVFGQAPGSTIGQAVGCIQETGRIQNPPLHCLGDYQLLEKVARGGMGIVYKARQISLNRIVAVKVLLFGKFSTQEFIKRFQIEAELAASLKHPNIVPIHEVGQHEGQHYLSMDYVDGKNLAQRMTDVALPMADVQNPLSRSAIRERQAAIARLVSTIAGAVHYAHQRGVLHRDIKPSNILLDAQGEPHLTDFGLAKVLEKDSTLTQTYAVMGTPAYMSPEQARGEAKSITTAADVYGLGALIYEMLTKSPPFVAATSLETARQVLEQEPRRPSLLNGSVDRDLETVCLKCLEKDPRRRYPSAEALSEDLHRWLRHEPILARAATRTERVQKWAVRHPLVAGLAVGIVAVFLLGLATTFWQWRRAAAGELTARQNLYASLVREARATRIARGVGYRDEVFKLIRQARNLGVPQKDLAELRHEAVACRRGRAASSDGKPSASGPTPELRSRQPPFAVR